MIRKCTEKDRMELWSFLKKEEALNVFLLGDIEQYGFEAAFQEVWADFESSGRVQGVLLRYERNYMVYAKEDGYDFSAFAEVIRSGAEWDMLHAKAGIADRLASLLEFRRKNDLFFAELPANAGIGPVASDGPEPRKAEERDVDALLSLRKHIEEFQSNPPARESMKRNIRLGAARTYFIENNGQAVASASTTAEYSGGAMVVAVCTHPEYRNKGYATRCIGKLCQEVSAEGKNLSLFYDNPVAGAIYKRFGFRDIGKWSMCYA